MKTISMICALAAALMTGAGCSGQEQPKVSAEPASVTNHKCLKRVEFA